MTLIVNGQETAYEGAPNLSALLDKLGHEVGAVAVAVNEEFVARSQYAETTLEDGDHLDIVAPMQGG